MTNLSVNLNKVALLRNSRSFGIPSVITNGFWLSSFALANQNLVEQGVNVLAADLSSGEWKKKYGEIYNLKEIDIGYRFICATPDH